MSLPLDLPELPGEPAGHDSRPRVSPQVKENSPLQSLVSMAILVNQGREGRAISQLPIQLPVQERFSYKYDATKER